MYFSTYDLPILHVSHASWREAQNLHPNTLWSVLADLLLDLEVKYNFGI